MSDLTLEEAIARELHHEADDGSTWDDMRETQRILWLAMADRVIRQAVRPALATAVARARREALEEAAEAAEAHEASITGSPGGGYYGFAAAIRALAATPPEARQTETGALADIAAERRRQVEAEGWTPEHDDAHDKCELAQAAACYALARSPVKIEREWVYPDPPKVWPWHSSWWKPNFYRRNLVKAGALIVAEIERWDRASPPPPAIGNLEGEGQS